LTDIEPRPSPREALRRSGMIATPLPGDEADLENIVNPVLARGPDETGVGPEREFTVKARSQSQLVIRRFLRHRPAIISLIVLGLVVFLAFIFAPYIWDYDFKGEPRTLPNIKPTLDLIPWIDGDGLAFGAHPFGTDGIGADYFALTMTGARKSLQIALLVSFVATALGVLVGAIAGYFRGTADTLLMRFVDLMLVIPSIAIAVVLGRNIKGGGWWIVVPILAFTLWMSTSRIIRGEFLSLREKEFVEAARAIGASDRRIIFKHMLPNVIGSIIVSATLIVAIAILAETALSYLGLGVKLPDSSLGLLVSLNQTAFTTRPWLFWYPGVFILLIAITINFIGDGVRDAFDPKQTRVRA
jgi:ABC-type dipeptide/oligopeptide/nickel transport system permease subunit